MAMMSLSKLNPFWKTPIRKRESGGFSLSPIHGRGWEDGRWGQLEGMLMETRAILLNQRVQHCWIV